MSAITARTRRRHYDDYAPCTNIHQVLARALDRFENLPGASKADVAKHLASMTRHLARTFGGMDGLLDTTRAELDAYQKIWANIANLAELQNNHAMPIACDVFCSFIHFQAAGDVLAARRAQKAMEDIARHLPVPEAARDGGLRQ